MHDAAELTLCRAAWDCPTTAVVHLVGGALINVDKAVLSDASAGAGADNFKIEMAEAVTQRRNPQVEVWKYVLFRLKPIWQKYVRDDDPPPLFFFFPKKEKDSNLLRQPKLARLINRACLPPQKLPSKPTSQA